MFILAITSFQPESKISFTNIPTIFSSEILEAALADDDKNREFIHINGEVHDPQGGFGGGGGGGGGGGRAAQQPKRHLNEGLIELENDFEGRKIVQFVNTRKLDSLFEGDKVGLLIRRENILGIEVPIGYDICYPGTCH